MKEMVGGCCVCSDERGWSENPLVYCDGQGCTVAVHQACYGIVTVPTGPWYCRKCESQERAARVRCDLCPSRDGALKRTDSSGWAHVVCALYIPEVRFGNVTTMEPIILQLIPPERFNKVCYICQEMNKGGRASIGACMQCNKSGCKQQFHVTCAQALGLLCEEAGNYLDNVKYCGYCQHHYSKLKKGGNVKTIPPYKPIPTEQNSSDSSPEKEPEPILSPMVGIPVVTQPPKQPTPVPKSDPQPTKSSGRKSSSGSKSVSSSASSSSSNSSSVSAGLKNLTVNLTKEKHISKNSKGTTQSKSYDKDKSSRSQKSLTPTSSSTSSSNKSQKESTQSSDTDRKTPVLDNTKTTEKSVSKKDSKDHNNQKFSNSNITDTVNSDSLVGDNKDYTSGSKSSVMKKRKVESRTSTPIPMQENHLGDANHQLTQNVIVNLSDAKEAVEEKHKKVKTEVSTSSTQIQEGTQSTSAGAHSSTTQHAVASTSQSALKTDSVSPIPQGQVNPSLYQQLARNEHSSDRLNNSRQSPVVTSVTGQQSPLVDQGLSNSSTMSALNAMHAQTSQQGPNQSPIMHHQIGAVPINQSVVHPSSSGQNMSTLSSEMSGGGLKITYEKQTKADEPTKRSRFQNGVHAPHMLGNQLNPNSNMAQKMSDHLNHELEAHSVFSGTIGGGSAGMNTDGDNSQGALLVGPPLLRNTGATRATAPTSGIGNLLGGSATAPGNTGGNGMGAAVPQSLDQLLERQWEQGSQFLMEQAQHFDIASLLSCLHQLRTENARLEDHVNTLVARRDHLLAVNARLAIPLTQPIPPGNAGGGVLRAGTNPGENGGPQEYRHVRHSPANQYVSVGIIPPPHGQLRPQGPVEGARGNRASYQPYPVVTTPHQQQQLPMRRDPDRDTHHSQKPN